jgi:hypothetical protein
MDFIGIHGCSKVATIGKTVSSQHKFYRDQNEVPNTLISLYPSIEITGSGNGLIGLFDPNVTGSVGSGSNSVWSNLISGELANSIGGHKGDLSFKNNSYTGYANQMEANIYGRSVKHFQFDGVDDYMGGEQGVGGGGPGDKGGGYTSSAFFFDFNRPWSQCHWVYIPEKTGDALYPISSSIAESPYGSSYYELGVHVTGGNSCFYVDAPQVGIGSDAKALGNKILEPNHWHMVSLVFFPKLGEFDSHVNMYVNKQPDGLRFETTGQLPYSYPEIGGPAYYAINQSLMDFMYSATSSDIDNCAIQIGKGKTLYTDSEFKHGHFIAYDLPITLSQIRTNYEVLREFYVLDPTNE